MNRHRELLQRAEAFLRADKLPEAHAVCESLLREAPQFAPALHLSALVLYRAGQLPAATERFRAAVIADPTLADGWSNLGIALEAAGQPKAAATALERAVELDANAVQYRCNLAAIRLGLGEFAESEAAARAALRIDDHAFAAWYNLAHALSAQGRALEALDAATRALAITPADTACAGLKAQLQETIGAFDKARATLETALARAPLTLPLRLQLAGVHERSGAWSQAVAAYEQVLRQDPVNAAALSQLAFLKRRVADWRDLAALDARYRMLATRDNAVALPPFVLLSQASTRAEQRRCAETWTRAFAPPPPPTRRRRLSQGRLRIGYMSSDLFEHATAFLTAGMFEQHDRARFEIVAYSTGHSDESPMRRRLEQAFDRFVDARSMPPARLADRIRDERVDILVDLKGHTAGASLSVLLFRPAPIQVHYLGYPGTLGGAVDYLIGDAIVTPDAHAADYSEALVRLPHCYQVNDRDRPIASAPSRRDLGLPEDALVLCNFNQGYKINAAVLDAWTQILRAVPQAVLWLLAHDADDPVIANLRREAQARGIAPERLVFATHRPNPDYLGLYRRADLFLDTWPYNAHTTGSDALWAGCPLLTWLGDTFAGRVGASLVTAAGLPELVCRDVDAYVRRAIDLARDPAARARYRAHLEGPGRASPLFDTAATTRAIEAAYEAMAEQYRRITRAPIDL